MEKKLRLVLASGSPRRREILSLFKEDIKIVPSNVDETQLPNESPKDYVLRLAQDKASDVANNLLDNANDSESLVIGADTIVLYNNLVLGKPTNKEDAKRMLEMLSGNWHEVLTGVAVVDLLNKKKVFDVCQTRVKFSTLSNVEIDWYIETNEPFDKAGAYAIQGYGSLFVEEIEGNYLNVVGLPITMLRKLLKELVVDLI
jgi:septum formation protein